MTAITDVAGSGDGRPCYRVATFGLASRFQRLLDIILRHSRHNPIQYVLADRPGPGEFDIALVDLTAKGGTEIARTLKVVPQALPVIGVGRRASHARGPDDLLFKSFSLDVLEVLNRAAEAIALRHRTREISTRLTQPAAETRVPPVHGRAPRALVIDASASIRSQVAVAMRQIGVDAEGVGTLAQARDVLSMRSYELVVMELEHPDGDGLELLRRLRGGSKTGRRLPVVILSQRTGWFDLGKAALAGCNGFLGKPVALSTLHATARRLLLQTGARPVRKAAAAPAQAPAPAPATASRPSRADEALPVMPAIGARAA
ncbi:MAG: response regulator transcription factor [Lautropia sp.]